nr:MAG: hypothetical protein EDM05_07365 [Leptolyngbya sp. IPPAS B-1204]
MGGHSYTNRLLALANIASETFSDLVDLAMLWSRCSDGASGSPWFVAQIGSSGLIRIALG